MPTPPPWLETLPSDVRLPPRLARLRAQLERGEYHIDLDQLAVRMITSRVIGTLR